MSIYCPKCGNKLQLECSIKNYTYKWYGGCSCGYCTKMYDTQLEVIELLEMNKNKFITFSSSCG